MQKTAQPATNSREVRIKQYQQVRDETGCACRPLETEDFVVQSMPDVSPIRWHLAHTTWFFEQFVLSAQTTDYRPFDLAYAALFNSYYNSIGEQFPRPQRGLLTRPTVEQVFQYRKEIDHRIEKLLAQCDEATLERCWPIIELGLHHEQQHCELIYTDIKHVLSCNPLYPAYDGSERERNSASETAAIGLDWHDGPSGVQWIGHEGPGFAYDNESPRHQEFIAEHQLANRLTTNAEYLQFVEDGGYQRPELWLSLGWQTVCDEAWEAPLYWVRRDDQWYEFTLHGLRPLDIYAPVCHVSYFEADAFARWADARLPTEAEWEASASQVPITGNFVEQRSLHPMAATQTDHQCTPEQMFGDVWEWTSSSYAPYPGYRPPPGAVGEYNGKFMCNQYVLRGGSCATSQTHIRPTYRNFFPPDARWQFSGIRLAR